jgi:hypothetical protein
MTTDTNEGHNCLTCSKWTGTTCESSGESRTEEQVVFIVRVGMVCDDWESRQGSDEILLH